MISEHGELSLVFAVQVCVSCSAGGTRPAELWLRRRSPGYQLDRPPVPTELISVLILHTGSVQQEQSQTLKQKPSCKCPGGLGAETAAAEDRPGATFGFGKLTVVAPLYVSYVWVSVQSEFC